MHYRSWFELLSEAGHEVVGKDPLAVFLIQMSRWLRFGGALPTGKLGPYATVVDS
jgi:hypothetical protein